jgi:hypothetical protein
VTEGFFGPLFFVWLGASLDLHALGSRPGLILLGLLLGVGALLSHSLARPTGQPLSLSSLAARAARSPGRGSDRGHEPERPPAGEPAALVLGALVTIAAATIAGGFSRPAGTPQLPPKTGGPT